jgi:hypothetical protein
MTTTMKTSSKVVLALILGFGGAAVSQNASAADWNFSFGFGRPVVVEHCPPPIVVAKPFPPPTRTVRTWVPERYESREEQVLVAPERHDRVWIEPEYTTRYEKHGRHTHTTKVLVRPGYWKEVCIPARYETRCTQVLIPGYWTETIVDNRHDHGDDRWNDRRYDDRNDRRDDDRRYESGRFDPHNSRDKKEVAIKISARK